MDGRKPKKTGIMGGTFNPIHNGHIEIAKAAYHQFSMDEVLFLPNKNPPHKQGIPLADHRQRMDMVKLAIQPYPYFQLSTIEIDRKGWSYTVDTLRFLKQQSPACELYFIVGADSLHDMERWREPEEIFRLATILSAPRFPKTRDEDLECQEMLAERYGANIEFIQMEPIPVASRTILEQLNGNREFLADNRLPPRVWDYICSHQVYESR